jgi:hypothetical protein
MRSFVNLLTIEAPSLQIASSREPLELFDATLRIVSAGHRLQVVANELIETLPESFGPLSRTSNELLTDGKSYVHCHSICGHVLCVRPKRGFGPFFSTSGL